MPGDARGNPDDLRRFARSLRQFKTQVESQLNGLDGQFRGLSWNDAQQQKFANEWQSMQRSLRRFLQDLDHHVPYLEKKAKQLEDYLR